MTRLYRSFGTEPAAPARAALAGAAGSGRRSIDIDELVTAEQHAGQPGPGRPPFRPELRRLAQVFRRGTALLVGRRAAQGQAVGPLDPRRVVAGFSEEAVRKLAGLFVDEWVVEEKQRLRRHR